MEKQIALTLDCAVPVNPANFFQIWRCDKLAFTFTFVKDGTAMVLPEGTTARVFAKRVGADGMVYSDETPIFSGEFSTPTTATFTSDETAGAAGHYLLSVILYSSDSELITQQGIYFDILENGYAGIVQPAEDFRDEVLDARDQAESYAEDAAAEALVAEGFAVGEQSGTPVESGTYYENNAKYYNTQASSSAGAAAASEGSSKLYAETSEAYAVGTKNGVADPDFAENNSKYFSEQAGNSASAALASATNAGNSATAAAASAATAATLVINATELGQTKLNAGALHVSNGVASNSTFSIPPAFSVAVMVSPDYVGDIITLGALTISAASGTITASDGVDSLSVAASTTSQNVVVFTHSSINSVLTVNGSSDSSVMSQISGTGYTVGSSSSASGAISNLKIFNFDITASGAPYTIDDYTAGKPVPPSIKFGGVIADTGDITVGDISGVNMTPTLSDGVIAVSDDGSKTSYSIRIPLNRTVKAGETVLLDLTIATLDKWTGINLRTTDNSANSSALIGGAYNRPTGVYPVQATADSGYILFFKNTARVATSISTAFKISKPGETLALENYTVQNGVTQTVFDVSGNAYDATVSGVINGDNDISVARLVDFISAI